MDYRRQQQWPSNQPVWNQPSRFTSNVPNNQAPSNWHSNMFRHGNNSNAYHTWLPSTQFNQPYVPGFSNEENNSQLPGRASFHGRSRFSVDVACHPMNGTYCSSRPEAEALMNRHYGGYYNGQRCLLGDGTSKSRNQNGSIIRFKCRVAHCPLRLQLREYEFQGWLVFSPQYNVRHNHDLHERTNNPKDQYGIHPIIKGILDRHLSSSPKSILTTTPTELLLYVTKVVRENQQYASITYQVLEYEFISHLKKQIQNYVSLRRESYVKAKLSGVSRINNYDTLTRLLEIWKLNIPVGYEPRSDYKSAEEIAKALNLPSTYEMLVFDISSGRIYETFKQKAFNKPNQRQDFDSKMEYSFFIYSANCLFHLLTLSLRRTGTRCLGGDGTGGVFRDGSVLTVLGCNSVRLRTEYDQVTSSKRVTCYLRAGGERLYPHLVTLYCLRQLCWSLFNVELTLDWGSSDHADAFVSAYISFQRNPTLCDSSYRQFDDISTFSSTSFRPISEDRPNELPYVSQFSQENQSASECIGNCQQWLVRNRSCHCNTAEESALQCAFHALQPFAKKNSYVAKFKDKSLFTNRRKGKTLITTGPAYEQCLAIKNTRTVAQRKAVTGLVLDHWRAIGEQEAADHFEDQWCTWPHYNWNIGASGEPGVNPSGNPDETHNKQIKSPFTELIKNCSTATFLAHNGPRLLETDALLRADPCTIVFPTSCSIVMTAVAGFLLPNVDYRDIHIGSNNNSKADGVLFNRAWNVGIPLSNDRVVQTFSSYSGNTKSFTSNDGKQTQWDVAKKMINTTNGACFVKQNVDGVWIGNCNDCYQHLGYNCEGCTLMRDRCNFFSVPLATRRKTIANRRGKVSGGTSAGNCSNMYWSGSSAKKRDLPPSLTTFDAYLESLNREQMCLVVDHLRLLDRGTLSSQLSDKKLLYTLLQFKKDTVAYRIQQKERNRVATGDRKRPATDTDKQVVHQEQKINRII